MDKGIEHSEINIGLHSANGSGNPQDGDSIINPHHAVPLTSEPNDRYQDSQPNKKNTKGVSSTARGFLWSAAFILTATMSAIVGATAVLFTPIAPIIGLSKGGAAQDQHWRYGFQYRLARPVNILVMGVDRVLDAPPNSATVFSGRTDTMLLLRLDPQDHSVTMLSIPRDTRVESSNLTIPKINQANVEGGSALAARIVSRTLNNVAIDRYVRVSTDAFRELVNYVGGIEVFVPQPMHYVDNTQNLKIELEQGWQTLNGDQAEQFARFRKDQFGDIGRVQRQQILMKALRQRLVNPSVLPRLPQIVQVIWKYVDTNLSLEETLSLANFGLNLQPEGIKMVMLPGRFSQPNEYSASYWLMDPVGRDRIMKEFFHRQPKVQTENSSALNQTPEQIRIAVQNATDQPELGHSVAKYLREKGFKNIYVVNDWQDFQNQTQIIVQQGDLAAAKRIENLLGFGKIEASSTGDIQSDLTIRVGRDWIPR